MNKKRRNVILSDIQTVLTQNLFRQDIPADVIVRENPRAITHYHSYGGLSKFYIGLAGGVLLGSKCDFCLNAGVWLPPRVHCPDCWERMRWHKVNTENARVYTHSVINYPGAGFKASTPCPIISVEIPGVCTKLMSYLSEFGKWEPYIGMRIRPVFSKEPTYTILDLSWVPDTD